MSKISAFPAAAALGGTEKIATVQSGADVAVTPAQVATYLQALNLAFSGVVNFAKIPSWAWQDLAAATALTNGVPWYGAAAGTKTYTFTDNTPNGTSSPNWVRLLLVVSGGTQTINFPASVRIGSTSVSTITTLSVPVGTYELLWGYANGIWYLRDTVPGVAAVANGGTAVAYDTINGAEITLASATTTDIGAQVSDKVSITGTTTITGFGSATQAGLVRRGRFTGILTLTHNASTLILPGAANITTAAGDSFEAVALDNAGAWVVYRYDRKSGMALVGQGMTLSYLYNSGSTWAANTDYYNGWIGSLNNTVAARYKIPVPQNISFLDSYTVTFPGNLAANGDTTHSFTFDIYYNGSQVASSAFTVTANTIASGYVVQVTGINQAVVPWNGTTGYFEFHLKSTTGATAFASTCVFMPTFR